MQQAAFDALGIDARFDVVDRTPVELPETIAALRSDEFLGANITIPYKERVSSMVDRVTEEAHATGAIDSITREASRLVGHNTDVPGFRSALDALVGRQKMPRAAVVLGAGGGARAVVYALITLGFHRIVVFNRHLHRGEALVRHFARSAAHMELRAMPWHESVIEAELAKTKVLVNASSLGTIPDQTPIPGELIPPDLLVLDLVFTSKETRLMREARAAGASGVANGDVMLVHQSARAFELWTGRPAPIDLMRQALEVARERAVTLATETTSVSPAGDEAGSAAAGPVETGAARGA